MISPEKIIEDFELNPSEKASIVKEFLSDQSKGKRFVMGYNEHSRALANVVEIDGYIDDFTHGDVLFEGKPVIKGEQVPSEAIVVNCSMSISPVSAGKRLNELHVSGTIAYCDLLREASELISVPQFVKESREDIKNNWKNWQRLYNALADAESKQVLDDILSYRLTGDSFYMAKYAVRFKDQYFEPFLNLQNEVFVDAGGFDGDTTEEFCKRYPDYKKVYIFEPSSTNIAKAKKRLANFREINFLELGISDMVGTLWFDPDAGSASSVSESGTCKIEVTTLDQQIEEPITFLKMDLEGWENNALAGARQHILNDHPKLAISVYHHPSDFWQVFEYVLQLRSDYKVYLRHYTEGWSETVMYFVPIEE